VINPLRDDLLTLNQVQHLPALLRPDGRPRDLSCIYRWALRGVRGASGQRIKLETIKTPSGMRTTAAAVAAFLAALNDPNATDGVALDRSPAERGRDHGRADRELAESGW
jgi:Protein of unknown function (DUF1580)